MKKTYQKPEVVIYITELQQMIALSKQGGDANPNGEVLSRQGVMWDDDDEFEDY